MNLWIRACSLCSKISPLVSEEASVPRQFPKFFMISLYVIKSVRYGTSYVGITTNLTKRLNDHNGSRVKSTKHGVPWKLIHSENFATLSEAKKREWFFKCTPQGGKLKRKILETAGIPAA